MKEGYLGMLGPDYTAAIIIGFVFGIIGIVMVIWGVSIADSDIATIGGIISFLGIGFIILGVAGKRWKVPPANF